MKRIITMALAVILLFGCLPAPVQAAQLGMSAVGSSGYKNMTISQKMLDMIKVMEGFSHTPYKDNTQWTIGYGCSAGPISASPTISYVTLEEGEALLIEQMKSYEKSVNSFCKKIGKQPTQNQFDALVDFTYNLGEKWTTESQLATWLKNPTTELGFVNAIGQWVRAGGKLQFSQTQRRIRESIIFFKNEYYLNKKPDANSNVKSDLKVISDGALPYYSSVIYQYDYDTETRAKGVGNAVGYFYKGGTYTNLHVTTREGYTLMGWKITKINNKSSSEGTMVTEYTKVEENLELTAVWAKGNVEVPPADGLPFTDISANAWYRDEVKTVYDMGLMNGVSETMFNPKGNMTRGMLVTVLYRMDGEEPVTDEQRASFTDISGKYYTDAVAWASSYDIVNGVGNRKFAPNEYVTRQDAVTILHRYFVEYAFLSQDPGGKLQGFKDISSVSGYACSAMQWAVNIGLVTGTEENNQLYLKPKDLITRSQMAAILARCINEFY